MKKLTVLVVIMLVASLLAGCWVFPESKLDYIEAKVNVAALGIVSTRQLKVTAYYEDLTEADVTIDCEYLSSNPDVAIVNNEGLITSKIIGEATILVTYTQHNFWTGRIIRTDEVNVTVEY